MNEAGIISAVALGQEMGLSVMQSIKSIKVINGQASVYGDGMLALCMKHPDFMDIDETEVGDPQKDINSWGFRCTVKRRGKAPCVREFFVKDARRAGLWGNKGPWQTYPRRMLQMRARGFALRDSFPDALMGIISAEEAGDYPSEQQTTEHRSLAQSMRNDPPQSEERDANEVLEAFREG